MLGAAAGNPSAFSVIVPSFNRADLLTFTLDAILGQQLQPAEVIVADDGSTDDTADIVARYGGRVRHLPLANGGPPAARHAGVLASRCALIAFCDSDDIWLPDHLFALRGLLKFAPYVFSNFVHIRNDEWETKDKFANAPPGYWGRATRPVDERTLLAEAPLFPDILEFQPIFPSCTAMTRRFYDHVGGYNAAFGRVPSEDLEFTLRCVREAPTAIALRPTVGIRKHGKNRSANVSRQIRGEIEVLRWSREHHRVLPEWAAGIDREIAARTLMAFDDAFAASGLAVARSLIPDLRLDPLSCKTRLKRVIAALPDALAIRISAVLARPRNRTD
jgi:glycosyltransferase involved in cell wall biosynthesis